jgi:enoyl-CoA hydratase/carnithine racemase
MDYQSIQTQKRPEKIGIITLNRPERKNALSGRFSLDISDCLKDWVDASCR